MKATTKIFVSLLMMIGTLAASHATSVAIAITQTKKCYIFKQDKLIATDICQIQQTMISGLYLSYNLPKFGNYHIQYPPEDKLSFYHINFQDTKTTRHFRLKDTLKKVKVSEKKAKSYRYLWCFKHQQSSFEICSTNPTNDDLYYNQE